LITGKNQQPTANSQQPTAFTSFKTPTHSPAKTQRDLDHFSCLGLGQPTAVLSPHTIQKEWKKEEGIQNSRTAKN